MKTIIAAMLGFALVLAPAPAEAKSSKSSSRCAVTGNCVLPSYNTFCKTKGRIKTKPKCGIRWINYGPR